MGGTADKAKGKVKQAAGDLADDEDLKDEGRMDELTGKAKDALHDLKDKAEDAVDAVKDRVSRRS